MILLLFIILVFIMLLISPFMRFIVKHPFLCGKYFILDKKDYYQHKRYNEFKDYGRIFTFTASGSKAFGSGKTLSMVNWVRSVYRKYNGLPVWDYSVQEFVKQRIIVISCSVCSSFSISVNCSRPLNGINGISLNSTFDITIIRCFTNSCTE